MKGLSSYNLRDHMSEAKLILPLWPSCPSGKLQKVRRPPASRKQVRRQGPQPIGKPGRQVGGHRRQLPVTGCAQVSENRQSHQATQKRVKPSRALYN